MPETISLHGDIHVGRPADGKAIGRITIENETFVAKRYHGIFGAGESGRFDSLDAASKWIAASENIPLEKPGDKRFRAICGGEYLRLQIFPLPGDGFIGIDPNGKRGPAIFPATEKTRYRQNQYGIRKTQKGWSVKKCGWHVGHKKSLEEALVLLAECAAPEDSSAHMKMSWMAEVIEPLKKQLEKDGLAFDPGLIPVDPKNDYY